MGTFTLIAIIASVLSMINFAVGQMPIYRALVPLAATVVFGIRMFDGL
jgi:hypothetical protein